jgi:peptide/nickel transport system substrate-binding protein
LRIPVATTIPQFDLASPRYRGLNPATYMVLAFCYESLGAPSSRPDNGGPVPGAVTPDYARMVPRLAEAFHEEPDGSWLLRLRSGVRSHQGNELTADDIKWTFDQAFARESVAAYRWGQIAGLAEPADLQVVDKRTLRFNLRAPNPNVEAFFFGGAPPILDSTALRAHATNRDPWGAEWIASGKVAGYGPYEIQRITPYEIEFKARTDYWAGTAPVPSVIVESVGSRAEALRALHSSDAVYVVGLRPDEVRGLRGREDLFESVSWAGHAYLGMSYDLPPFDDVRVRHALSYATPYREVIEKGLLGLGRRWRGPITSYDAWQTEGSRYYDTDEQKAKELLREAGFAQGLSLALYLQSRPDLVRIGEILRVAYARVGIDLELRDTLDLFPGWVPAFVLRTECGHNFNEPVYDISHDYIPTQPLTAGSSGKFVTETRNTGYTNSREFDSMYRGILTAPSGDERRHRAQRMQEAIIDFAPFVYLAENIQVNVGNSHLSEWMRDHRSRPVQALQFQNCGTGYIG